MEVNALIKGTKSILFPGAYPYSVGWEGGGDWAGDKNISNVFDIKANTTKNVFS